MRVISIRTEHQPARPNPIPGLNLPPVAARSVILIDVEGYGRNAERRTLEIDAGRPEANDPEAAARASHAADLANYRAGD